MTEKEAGHCIKVINAGNCMLCGRKIMIDTCKEGDKLPNIFFCPRCEKRRVKKDKSQESEELDADSN